MKKYPSRSAFCSAMISSVALPLMPAASAAVLEEVIVSAQKNVENLQDVPISVSSVSADSLEKQGVASLRDLSTATPGVNLRSSASITLLPSIRGVGAAVAGPGIENSVALYIDEVYIASPVASMTNLNNIERVEVLKGPQGTLFGRNATGGLVHVITKDPSAELTGKLSLSYGNYNTLTTKAYLSSGITDNTAADLAYFLTEQREGYGENLYNGKDANRLNRDFAVRSKWVTTLDRATISLSGDYSRMKGSMLALKPAGEPLPTVFTFDPVSGTFPPFPGGTQDVNSSVQPHSEYEGGGASVRVEYAFDSFDLVSITAYRNDSGFSDVDVDLTPASVIDLHLEIESDQLSQELQMHGEFSPDFTWITGAYYFESDGGFSPGEYKFGPPIVATPFSPVLLRNEGRQETNAYAVFGQTTYDVDDLTSVTVGLRYNYEKRRLYGSDEAILQNGLFIYPVHPNIEKTVDYDKLVWRLVLDRHLSDRSFGYVSYNRGFKSGGFNPNSLADKPFDQEILDAYEIGLKTELMDGALRFNNAAYYYDYKNIQVPYFVAGDQRIRSGSSADIYGFESELQMSVTDNLNIAVGFAFTKAEFTEMDNADFYVGCPVGAPVPCQQSAKGNELGTVPKTTANFGANYTIPLESGRMELNATYYYNDGWYSDPAHTYRQSSYTLLNASIGWVSSDDNYGIKLWGKNLEDEVYASQLAATELGGAMSVAPPRTYGITVDIGF
jgi:iron complex outermembrane receptor protein